MSDYDDEYDDMNHIEAGVLFIKRYVHRTSQELDFRYLSGICCTSCVDCCDFLDFFYFFLVNLCNW